MKNKIEAVQILEWRFNYFPRRFRWRGRQFEVIQVEQVRSMRREWPRRSQRRNYQVTTDCGRFTLCHDLLHDIWSIHGTQAQFRDMRRSEVTQVDRKIRSVVHGHRLVVVR